jgi:hypothetical protein
VSQAERGLTGIDASAEELPFEDRVELTEVGGEIGFAPKRVCRTLEPLMPVLAKLSSNAGSLLGRFTSNQSGLFTLKSWMKSAIRSRRSPARILLLPFCAAAGDCARIQQQPGEKHRPAAHTHTSTACHCSHKPRSFVSAFAERPLAPVHSCFAADCRISNELIDDE